MRQSGNIQPCVPEIEDALIGAILLEPFVLPKVVAMLKPECFYKSDNRLIFTACVALWQSNQVIDILTTTQKLKALNQLESVGGPYGVSSKTNRVASSANAEIHAALIYEKFVLRELMRISNKTQMLCEEPKADALDILEQVFKEFSKVDFIGKSNVQQVGDVAMAVIEQIKKIGPDHVKPGIGTGHKGVDCYYSKQKQDLTIIAARPGQGKAQPHFAKVLTPNGFVTMGEIKPGDKIINSQGGVSYVTGKFPQGSKQIFEVLFSDDTKTYCCDEHLWLTKTRKERKNYLPPTVKNTKNIIDSIRVTKDKRLNHSVEYVRPVEFKEKLIPIHPYLLGVIIGDFCNSKMQIMNPEKDIIEKISGLLPTGDQLRKIKSKDTYSVVGKKTRAALRFFGLSDCRSYEKFIPSQYLYNSTENRIDLLRGLMDTDGFVLEKSYLEYCTTSLRLSKDIKNLVLSLGGRCTIHEHLGKCNGKTCRPYYRMNISFTNEILPVSSKKHLKKYSGSLRKLPKFIKSIEPCGEFECSCISVSSDDRLYVTDDYILTHNTAYMLSLAKHTSIKLQKPVAIFSLEMSTVKLVNRLMASESEVSSKNINEQRISSGELMALGGGITRLIDAPLYIDDTAGLDIMSLRSKVRKMKQQYGIEEVYIDYLQLMASKEKGNNREQEISHISRNLKMIAKDEDICITALSQLSRKVEERPSKKPQLSDLRESGAIEQDADTVFFIMRPEYYGMGADSGIYEGETFGGRNLNVSGLMLLDCAKYREGALFQSPLLFIGEYMQVLDHPQIYGQPEVVDYKAMQANDNFLNQ